MASESLLSVITHDRGTPARARVSARSAGEAATSKAHISKVTGFFTLSKQREAGVP